MAGRRPLTEWVGFAVAKALDLNLETSRKRISKLLKEWVATARSRSSKSSTISAISASSSWSEGGPRNDLKLKLAKWDPKRYGDRQLLGSDPDNPLPAGFQVQFVKGDEAS
jgi:hypothetical protein